MESEPVEDTENQNEKLSIPDGFEPRSPDSFILGKPTVTGECLPDIIDIDHSKNTAQFRYSGQPGDAIVLSIVMDDGSIQTEKFELGSHHTGWQVPTTINNSDIDHVEVEASGRVGKSSSCTISVN